MICPRYMQIGLCYMQKDVCYMQLAHGSRKLY